MVYHALALKLNCAIWTNDKKLKQQTKIKIYHTHELADL
jgi:predicted nucleic acid-binding protein